MMHCPHCHSELKDDATFCPHCGSDSETGWKEGAENSHLELPDYEEILENEFGQKKKPVSKIASAIIGGILAVVLLIVFTGVF
ncbi:MAG: zinc-ribbon domain-containing protein [Fibrobacter sp.]|nr:zinc-ribbon domain-containing protein [Fibrobacter sp.]